MGIDFPISANALLTVVGIAVLGSIITLWVKQFAGDWRWTPLVVLALCLLLAQGAQIVAAGWPPPLGAVLVALLIGFFGASLAVFGYETLVNALGKAGVGPRSEAAQVAKARDLLERYNT